MSLANRQALLARFLADEAVEARVRAHPDHVAAELSLPIAWVRWLAALPADRVLSFRRSRVHKDGLRAGKEPTQLDS